MDMRTRAKYLLTGIGVALCTILVLVHITGPRRGSVFDNLQEESQDFFINNHEQETQNDRLRRVQDICDSTQHSRDQLLPAEVFRNIYVDTKYKLLYCEVPKVACTNWKRILLILSGKVNTTDPNTLPARLVHGGYFAKHFQTLDRFSSEDVDKILRTYFKFMFVRDPLERLLSAYRNKFTVRYNKYFKDRYGTLIIRKFRANATVESLLYGHDVTFPEFVTYLLDPHTRKRPFNTHWRQYYQLCHPCLINYNFIGKYETLSPDVQKLLRQAGIEHLISFPRAPRISGVNSTAQVMEYYYRDIHPDDIHKLWQLYSVDYAMFGYQYPQTSRR